MLSTTRCIKCQQPTDGIICPSCEAKDKERNLQLNAQYIADQRARQGAAWKRICPEGYRNVQTGLMPQVLREFYETWDALNPASFTVLGPSGKGKTSAAFVFAGKAHFQGKRVKYWHASDLRGQMIKAAKAKNSDEWMGRFKHIFCSADLVVIDDFGQTAKTEASNECLLSLLESVRAKKVPTIITTQYTGAELAMSFGNSKAGSEKIGIAIARRIGKDYATMINLYEK